MSSHVWVVRKHPMTSRFAFGTGASKFFEIEGIYDNGEIAKGVCLKFNSNPNTRYHYTTTRKMIKNIP
jgi:hypothetical protein